MGTFLNDLNQFFWLFKRGTIFDRKINAYEKFGALQLFGTKQYIERGLSPEEAKLYAHFENTTGKALVVGCSAGRESIYLARKGWKVIGFDFIKDLIAIAKTFALRLGLDIDYRILDIKKIDRNTLAKESFDFIAFSIFFMILTSKERVRILKVLRDYLTLKGKIVVIFQGRRVKQRLTNPVLKLLLKVLKPSHEEGDYFDAATYLHVFTEEELKKEAAQAGFTVKDVAIGPIYKWALLEKV
jgi:2-polyprenyl-3-methyl-5-hydroxy-6-metoxy-1,4-benzoquinol methylase